MLTIPVQKDNYSDLQVACYVLIHDYMKRKLRNNEGKLTSLLNSVLAEALGIAGITLHHIDKYSVKLNQSLLPA